MTRHAHAVMLALVLVPAGIQPQFDAREPTSPEDQAAVEQFDRAVAGYVALHRQIERSFAAERTFEDPGEMYAERSELRKAIVAARPHARRGDIFAAAVSEVIRERLLGAIRRHPHDPADILADNRAERLPGPMPRVNRPFSWGLGAAMWPTLLAVLPPLPDELEYRFVDRDLVLIDMHPNLVVDILEDALPSSLPKEAVKQ